MTVWRLARQKFAPTAAEAYNGMGAAKRGGRWNSRGVAIAYASENAPLAMLETLAHLKEMGFVPPDYVLYRAEVPGDAVAPAVRPPAGWNTSPPSPGSAAFGDDFVSTGAHLAIAVPSVVMPAATNYLINPAHARFREMRFSDPIPCPIDRRLHP